jgi:hypothetical protein
MLLNGLTAIGKRQESALGKQPPNHLMDWTIGFSSSFS